MKAVHKRRLLLLADFLEKLPPERFDFNRWVGWNWRGAPDISCGASACALGWATTIPELHEAGLRLSIDRVEGIGVIHLASDVDFEFSDGPPRASRVVFGLSSREHERLFLPYTGIDDENGRLSREASAKQVADHIRQFVEAAQ